MSITTVSIELKEERLTGYLWLMFAICFLGNVLAGMASTIMSVYLPVVVSDLSGHVDEKNLNQVSAYVSGLYFIGWAMGGLTWGFIGDRIGRARSLAMTVSMFGLFTFLTSWATSWELVTVYRFFCGFGVGGTLVINTTLLSEVWPSRSRAIFIGILSVGFPVGIFSSGLVNYFVPNWRDGFLAGVLPMCLGIISLMILKESQLWKDSLTLSKNVKTNSDYEYRKNLVDGSILFGTMLIGLWAIFAWVPTWVQGLMGSADSQQERGLSMMALGGGGLSGGFFSGWLANTLGTRKAMMICFSGCFMLSIILFMGNHSFTIMTVAELALLAILFGMSQGLLSVYVPLLFPVSARATATGLCFNIGRFVTAAAVFFVGALVAIFGGYGQSLMAFSCVFLVGFLILIFKKNN